LRKLSRSFSYAKDRAKALNSSKSSEFMATALSRDQHEKMALDLFFTISYGRTQIHGRKLGEFGCRKHEFQ
jgi:hypothetical protein